MSVPVALEELARRVEEFGAYPFVISASHERQAHVVSVTIRFDGARFSFAAGQTTRTNISSSEAATLLWPGAGGPYGLIVDGTAALDGDAVTVTPTRAVLHRLADAPEDLPSCISIEQTS